MSKFDDTCDGSVPDDSFDSNKRKPRLTEKFVVRFPPLMRKEIHSVANRCKRSVNKEILARLEHSLVNFPTVPTAFNDNGAQLKIEQQAQILEHSSPEAEVILNFKLREMLGKLSFKQKVCFLKLLQSLQAV
jgi:hypothetical protein